MKRKLMVLAGAAMSMALVGCTNTQALEKSVAELNTKVDRLSVEVNALKQQQLNLSGEVADAKNAANNANSEAMRANDRIDRIATSYKK